MVLNLRDEESNWPPKLKSGCSILVFLNFGELTVAKTRRTTIPSDEFSLPVLRYWTTK